jgi:putative FmdB family regulatory protein
VPLYEYQCGRCGRFEVIRKFSDAPLTVCPTCGQEVQKLLSAPAIQFKGTGWYITDYARKSSGGDASQDGATKPPSGKDAAASKDGAKTEGTGKSGKSESTGKSESGGSTSSGASSEAASPAAKAGSGST